MAVTGGDERDGWTTDANEDVDDEAELAPLAFPLAGALVVPASSLTLGTFATFPCVHECNVCKCCMSCCCCRC